MKLSLGINIASIRAQRALDSSTSVVESAQSRLASGMRINKASDDAAGLSIVSSLNADARVFGQAIRNVNDGISLVNIAQGALEELSGILIRIRELASQASNGTYSRTQRLSLHAEARSLTEEYNRIVESTKFNGRSIIDGSYSKLWIQAGSGTEATIGFDLGQELSREIGIGSYTTGASYSGMTNISASQAGDLNRDGILDIVASGSRRYVLLGAGDGTFSGPTAIGTNTFGEQVELVDINQDGILDILSDIGNLEVMLGNGNGTFKAPVQYGSGIEASHDITAADFNGDGIIDVATTNFGNNVWMYYGNGNGTFKAVTTIFTGLNQVTGIQAVDMNGDGRQDLIFGEHSTSSVYVALGTGTGSFSSPVQYNYTGAGSVEILSHDFNHDGAMDVVVTTFAGTGMSVFLGNGDGSLKAPSLVGPAVAGQYGIQIGDLNGDGYGDLISAQFETGSVGVFIGNGDGTFASQTQITSPYPQSNSLIIGDLNGDGVDDIASGHYSTGRIQVFLTNTQSSSTIPFHNLTLPETARSAMEKIDSALLRVNSELSNIGAIQSRLDVTLNMLNSNLINYQAAASRILDADIADEVSKLIGAQILQQVGAAILAQANQNPQIVLNLLTP